MVARDHGGVRRLHDRLRVRLILDPAAPVFGPCVKDIAVGKVITRLIGPKGAERVGEIRAVRLHQAQQFVDQIHILGPGVRDAEFGRKTAKPCGFDQLGHVMHDFGGDFDGGLLVVHLLQKRSRKLRHVPHNDLRLVAIGITALPVDRTEHTALMKGIHKGAGAIVDRLARDAAIVGVHHTVDKAEGHPLRHQFRLRRTDRAQKAKRVLGLWVVSCDSIVGEGLERLRLTAMGKDLKSADAQMACGDAGDDGAGQRAAFAQDRLACGDSSQSAGGRHAERMHRLADQVFAQHRPNPSAAIAHTGIGSRPGTFELNVTALALAVDDLTQQDCTAIAKLRVEVAELMPGVKLRQGGRPCGHRIAAENLGAGLCIAAFDSERRRQIVVPCQELGFFYRRRVEPGKEPVGQGGIAVIKGNTHHSFRDISM